MPDVAPGGVTMSVVSVTVVMVPVGMRTFLKAASSPAWIVCVHCRMRSEACVLCLSRCSSYCRSSSCRSLFLQARKQETEPEFDEG